MRIMMAADLPSTAIGGITQHMTLLADRIRGDGHHVSLMFADHAGNYLGTPRLSKLSFASVLAWGALRGSDPRDLVCVHASEGFLYAAARHGFVGRRRLPPCVLMTYGMEDVQWAVQLAAPPGYVHTSPVNRLSMPLFLALTRLGMRRADHIIAVCDTNRKHLIEVIGVSPDRVTTIPHGVEDAFFRPRAAGGDEAILFVGRWNWVKGIATLSRALAGLLKARRHLRVTLAGTVADRSTVLGDFPADVHDRVTVLPQVPRAEVPSLVAAHSVFTIPSLCEGMPLSLIEAMASGLAVVATPVGGIPEFVENGVSGLLVPPGDEAALRSALAELLDHPELRRRLGAAAPAAVERCRIGRVAEQTIELFTRVVARDGSPSARPPRPG